MKIPGLGLTEIESSFHSLERNETNHHILEFDSKINEVMPFCTEASILQFIITWARKSSDNSILKFIHIDNNSIDTNLLKKNLGYPHYLAAWMLSSRIIDKNDKKIARNTINVFEEFLDAMDHYEFEFTHELSEERVNLICIQGGGREFIKPFYDQKSGKPVIKQLGEFRVVVQDILARLNNQWNSKELREISAPVSNLIRELVDNSHDWARSNEKNREYKRGIRSISFRVLKIDSANENKFSFGNTHIESYLATQLTDNKKSELIEIENRKIRRLNFLELSIVDSGPGLAKRWIGEKMRQKSENFDNLEMTIQEEEKYFIECFKKWHTSSNDTLRGIGLFSVANTIKKQNGFLRIRTGRLCYLFGTSSSFKKIERQYKSFLEENTSKKTDEHIILEGGTHLFTSNGEIVFYLQRWTEEKLAPTEGTAYSILIPT